jgi:alkylation response protein AidB-like acyl-CoA dehydrogenase
MTSGISPYPEEQAGQIAMLRESAQGLLGSGPTRARAFRFTEPGFDPALLRQMGEAGWIGVAVPEAAGGTGLGMGEMAALAEEIGSTLAPEPLTALQLSAHLLGGHPLLKALLAGEAVVLTAWQDRPNSLESGGEGPRRFVPMAAGATHILWPERDGLRLLGRDEVEITAEATQDGGHFGTVRRLAPGTALPGGDLAGALDRAALATAAELLGGMEAAFAMTLDYLRTRQQFGRIIGTFQALQHKAADARMQISLTRAAVEEAALAEAAPALASRAKARASEAAMAVQQACIQLHGGIGYTDDYDVGLYLRRAMVLAPLHGGAALHRRRFMALSPEMEDS